MEQIIGLVRKTFPSLVDLFHCKDNISYWQQNRRDTYLCCKGEFFVFVWLHWNDDFHKPIFSMKKVGVPGS